MIKKWLCLLLCVVLAASPALSLAEEDAFGWLDSWLQEESIPQTEGVLDDALAYDESTLLSWLESMLTEDGTGEMAGMLSSLLFAGSGGEVTSWENPKTAAFDETGSSDDTWAIYWYLCGSDLESKYGCATDDLIELLNASLPENVTVVIQTGGAKEWQNNIVEADRLQRWLFQGGELSLVGEEPQASMGHPQTLASFLDFCNRNFPADKRAVMFWNHGGGSVSGAAFDENFSNDSLTLSEMYTAVSAVFEPNVNEQPLELVGFDTCLMATVDVAYTFCDLAKYLVASEETAPSTGWDYTAWATALGNDPGMNGAQLGRVICDTYGEHATASSVQDSITLSLVDLSSIGNLVNAYVEYGTQALQASTEDTAFFSRFSRAAYRTESYGSNSREEGYTNMVDLGHLARLTTDMLPAAQDVLDGLDDCVIYRVNGPYRSEATGLSCYYSYDGDIDEIRNYEQQGIGTAFAEYYLYGVTGHMGQQGLELLHLEEQEAQQLPEVQTLADTNWDGMPLTVDENGTAWLELGPEANTILSGIGFQLYYVDNEQDLMLLLGTDNDMFIDWEKGMFGDNFRGVWGSLNGNLVHMSLSFEGEDYNLYSVPIMLNGEECHLEVAYDFTTEEWTILGAHYGLEPESGMSHRDVRLLRQGDEISILWYAASYSGDDSFFACETVTFVIEDELVFAESPLMDGVYSMIFEMWDAQGNYAYSDSIGFECEGGEIYTLLKE